MNPFGIAAVLGGRHRLKKVVKTGAKDRGKGIIEGDGWLKP